MDFFDFFMGVKVFVEGYDSGRDDLVDIIIDDFKFVKVFYFVGNFIIAVEVNRKGSFIYDGFDVCDFEVVVMIGVVKFGVDYIFFGEFVDLFVYKWVNFSVFDGVGEVFILKVDYF